MTPTAIARRQQFAARAQLEEKFGQKLDSMAAPERRTLETYLFRSIDAAELARSCAPFMYRAAMLEALASGDG